MERYCSCGKLYYGIYSIRCSECENKAQKNIKDIKNFALNHLAEQLLKHGAGPFVFELAGTTRIDIEEDMFVFYCTSSNIFEKNVSVFLKEAGIKYRVVEKCETDAQYVRNKILSLWNQ